MTGVIDIHAHILPGIDDGSRDWDESRRLLEESYRQGIRYIIATHRIIQDEDCLLTYMICRKSLRRKHERSHLISRLDWDRKRIITRD